MGVKDQNLHSVLLGREFPETKKTTAAMDNSSVRANSSNGYNIHRINMITFIEQASSLQERLDLISKSLPDFDYFRRKYDRLSRIVDLYLTGYQNLENNRQYFGLKRISLELKTIEPCVDALQTDLKDIKETLCMINQDPQNPSSVSDKNDADMDLDLDCITVQQDESCNIAVDQSKQYPHLHDLEVQADDQDELYPFLTNVVNQGQGHLRKGKDLVRILTKSSPIKKEIFGAQSLEDEKIETRKKNKRERIKRQRESWSPTRKKKENERKKRYRASWSPQRKAVELEKSRERWSRYYMKKNSKNSSMKSNGSATDRSWNARNQEVYKINKGLQQDATTEQQTAPTSEAERIEAENIEVRKRMKNEQERRRRAAWSPQRRAVEQMKSRERWYRYNAKKKAQNSEDMESSEDTTGEILTKLSELKTEALTSDVERIEAEKIEVRKRIRRENYQRQKAAWSPQRRAVECEKSKEWMKRYQAKKKAQNSEDMESNEDTTELQRKCDGLGELTKSSIPKMEAPTSEAEGTEAEKMARRTKQREYNQRRRATWSPQRVKLELEKSRERWDRYHAKKKAEASEHMILNKSSSQAVITKQHPELLKMLKSPGETERIEAEKIEVRRRKKRENYLRHKASWSPQRRAVELEKSRERWRRYRAKKKAENSEVKQADDSGNLGNDTERMVSDKEKDDKKVSENQITVQNLQQEPRLEPLKGKGPNLINGRDNVIIKLKQEASKTYFQAQQRLQTLSVNDKLFTQIPVQEEQRSTNPELHKHDIPTKVKYKCDFCSRAFKTKLILDRHISKHKGQGYGCETCGQTFELAKNLTKHKMEFHKNLFTCSLCPRRFNYAESLNDHMNEHKAEDVKLYECDFCNEKCYTYLALNIHRKTEHLNRFTCKVCGTKFRSQSAIDTHYHSHSQEDLCKNGITLDTKTCHICGFVTRRKTLSRHKKVKHPDLFQEETSIKYICEICGKVSDSSIRHKNHMRYHKYRKQNSEGTTGVKYPCKSCEKVFSSPVSLKYHVDNIHLELNAYLCNLCGKRLSTKHAFEYHMRTHSGERPFQCDLCERSFILKACYEDHMRYHRNEIVCKTCGMKFTCSNNLKRHINVVHKGLKKHKCHFCDKCFSERSTLNIHLNVHTGNKPYSCDECELSFGDPSTLFKHKRRHQEKSSLTE